MRTRIHSLDLTYWSMCRFLVPANASDMTIFVYTRELNLGWEERTMLCFLKGAQEANFFGH